MERTVAAITGASSGIGAAFARRLAPDHDLVLIARRKDRLDQLGTDLNQAFGTRVTVLAADLATEDGVASAADWISQQVSLGLLVNNAGFGTKGRFWEADFAEQERMHRLHVMAPLRLTHAALKRMVAQDFGAVVNVASVAAYVTSPGTTGYAATKSWMKTFTEGLHLELKSIRSNVTIQALCPGFTYSEFHDAMNLQRERLAGRSWWMSAEEVVEASLEGLRRRKLFVVPGWRYRVLTAVLPKLPDVVRLALESSSPAAKAKKLPRAEDSRRLAGTKPD